MASQKNQGENRTVTLAGVAKLAGVSEITVSRVVRGKSSVSESTRNRVREAIKTTGYIPNQIAGALASAGTNLVGVVVPSLGNIVFPDVIRGITNTLRPTSLRTVVAVTDYDLDEEADLVSSLLSWRPSGLILTGLEHTHETVRQLRDASMHIVEIMDIDSNPIDTAIGMSHTNAGRDMARHLLSRGYRKFGFVGHDLNRDKRAWKRYSGYRFALSEAGLNFVAEDISHGQSDVEGGKLGLQRLLEKSDDIDAVAFSNDDMAVGGIYYCMNANIAVPEKLAIVGFNGLAIGQHLPRRLTTILSPRYQIGQMAARSILDSLENRSGPSIIDAGYTLVEGETA